MFKQAIFTFILVGSLTIWPAQTVSAEPALAIGYSRMEMTTVPDFTNDLVQLSGMAIKRGEPYDEKKDPALRKGTENEEMPQGSFFAIPGLIVFIAMVFVWFNRE